MLHIKCCICNKNFNNSGKITKQRHSKSKSLSEAKLTETEAMVLSKSTTLLHDACFGIRSYQKAPLVSITLSVLAQAEKHQPASFSSMTTASVEAIPEEFDLPSQYPPDIVVCFPEILVQYCSREPKVFQLLALLSIIIK